MNLKDSMILYYICIQNPKDSLAEVMGKIPINPAPTQHVVTKHFEQWGDFFQRW